MQILVFVVICLTLTQNVPQYRPNFSWRFKKWIGSYGNQSHFLYNFYIGYQCLEIIINFTCLNMIDDERSLKMNYEVYKNFIVKRKQTRYNEKEEEKVLWYWYEWLKEIEVWKIKCRWRTCFFISDEVLF